MFLKNQEVSWPVDPAQMLPNVDVSYGKKMDVTVGYEARIDH